MHCNNNTIPRVVDLIINHSCSIKQDEVVFVEAIDIPDYFIETLLSSLLAKNAIPLLNIKKQSVINRLSAAARNELYDKLAEIDIYQMKQAESFIGLRAVNNIYELSHVSGKQKQIIFHKYIRPVHYEYRNKNLKWVYFRLPTKAMAQNALMSFKEFEQYYYGTTCIKYDLFNKSVEPLVKLLKKINNIRVISKNTDLSFSIKGVDVFKSMGKHNLPDGEVFTAPIKTSLNGNIKFNIDSVYYGVFFRDIELTFKDGQIVKAVCLNNQNKLNEILNTDKGSKFIGEFAIGLNPFVDKPINDILFDEKMFGSIHLAIGNAYPEADNGNISAIHWDLILNMNIKYGGGKLCFDEKLVQENGIFITSELEHLNPDSFQTQLKL